MRIAHVIWALETGGVETMLVDIANEQINSESVAVLVVNDLVNHVLLDNIDKRCKVKLFKRNVGSINPIPWLKLNVFLWWYHPDIIHLHLEGMRKMIFHPAPKVFTIHNMHTSGVEYQRFRKIFAISDAVKRHTYEQGYNSTLIWNGIHPEMIKSKNSGILKSLPRTRFVCVGRLFTPHKGQDILINALSILKKRVQSEFHLDLIGDGESMMQIEKMIQDLGVNKCVTLLGQKDRTYIYSHLCDYDLFILPSRSEGFGLSIIEAMCAGTPVLVSDLDGPMEIIENGRYGLYFKSGDSNDLANQLECFLKNGIEVERIENAKKYAITNFDVKTTASKYVDEYKKIFQN